MLRKLLIFGCALSFVLSGCSGCDEEGGNNDNNTADAGDTMMDADDDVMDTGGDTATDTGGDTAMDTGGDTTMDTGGDTMDAGDGTAFTLTITNTSDQTGAPTPYSPPLWAISDGTVNFPELGTEASMALASVAEDGMTGALETELGGVTGILNVGVSDTPVAPGDSKDLTFATENTDARLHLVTMFVQSNDVVLGTPPEGIALFDDNGDPVSVDEIADQMVLVDAGTERNQAPLMGPNQAPRQADANTGPAEGVVAAFDDSTRALPLASAFVDVTVTEDSGTFTLTFDNISDDNGVLVTPLGPVYWAVHNDQFMPWEPGTAASAGLETLAEDGSPADLISENSGATGLLDQGGAEVDGGSGPAMPGDTITIDVTPDSDNPYLTFASMVVQSNDAFWAPSSPVMLLDSAGDPRSADDVRADVMRTLAVYDAGTEVNEVPGQGPNTAPNQDAAGDGEAEGGTVELYADSTNDLNNIGDLLDVSIAEGANAGEFEVTIENISGGTAFPLLIAPVAWATHSDQVGLFEAGMPAADAIDGLEALAEDGDPAAMSTALNGLIGSGVGSAGVANIPDTATDPGPIAPSNTYTFTVTPDATNRFLSFVGMVVPSNDTFVGTSPSGIALLDVNGNPRNINAINGALQGGFGAWDAGTEANQAGAAGADQAPQQSGPNIGQAEGDGTIRLAGSGVWPYPMVGDIVSVSITAQ